MTFRRGAVCAAVACGFLASRDAKASSSPFTFAREQIVGATLLRRGMGENAHCPFRGRVAVKPEDVGHRPIAAPDVELLIRLTWPCNRPHI